MARGEDKAEVQTDLDLPPPGKFPPETARLRQFLETRLFQNTILVLIVMNAITLGLETVPEVMDQYQVILLRIDLVFLFIFVIELSLRIYAYRREFFKNGWNVFDFIIISASVLALPNVFSAFRAFRVLRVLHLVTVMPRMRVVVSALIDSIPGIMSVGVVLVLILYVFAVIASNLYGVTHPELFGHVFTSMYTLFQVMTLEGWPDVAGQVGEDHDYSWIFFVIFVLIATFTMLNLFVAIVVRVVEEDSEELETSLTHENAEIREEIHDLHNDVRRLQEMMVKMESNWDVVLERLSSQNGSRSD